MKRILTEGSRRNVGNIYTRGLRNAPRKIYVSKNRMNPTFVKTIKNIEEHQRVVAENIIQEKKKEDEQAKGIFIFVIGIVIFQVTACWWERNKYIKRHSKQNITVEEG